MYLNNGPFKIKEKKERKRIDWQFKSEVSTSLRTKVDNALVIIIVRESLKFACLKNYYKFDDENKDISTDY